MMSGPRKTPESRLLSLAPELVQTITDELDTSDICNLRLTCKDLCRQLQPRLFRTLSINVTKDRVANSLAKLRALATTNCAASYGTRKLLIGSLSPYFDPMYRGPSWHYVDGEWVAEPEPEDSPEVELAEQEIRDLLFPVISSFRGLRIVEWTPTAKDSEDAQATVLRALKALPNLTSLHFGIGDCKIPLSFDSFSGIQAISIVGTSEYHHEEIFDSLARLVARTPELSSIDIASNWHYRQGINKFQSLHDIFKYCPSDAPALRLRHLGMHVCLVRLDEVTMPHLRHLTSLNLSNIEETQARSRYTIFEAADSSIHQEHKRYGSSLEEVWKMLKQAEVRLEEISADVVVQPLLDYLASYSGVRKLHLTPGGFLKGTVSDIMAKEFFTGALRNHLQTMEELDINATFEGGWCFGSHNLFSIASCHKLKKLRMSVVNDKSSSDSYNIKLFIDTVSVSMPQLQTLHVFPSNSELLRDAFCGNPAMAHFARATRIMLGAIEEYRAPLSCSRLPALTIGCGKYFVPVSSARKGEVEEFPGMRYVDMAPESNKQDHDMWRYQSFVSL